MMTEIIREQSTIQKTNEITSEQVLSWAIKVEVQRAQKLLTEATIDNKEFNAIKKHEKKKNDRDRKEMHNNCKYCGSTHKPSRCSAYGRSCSRCRRVNHLSGYAEARARQASKDGRRERCKTDKDICHSDKEKEVATEEFDVVRSKVFNSHSIRAVLLAKFKIKLQSRNRYMQI